MDVGYWVTRTYQAGAVGEKTKFWVPGQRPEKGMSRRMKSEIRKRIQNEYSAVKRLARDLNANFTGGDTFLGLDYSAAGMEKLRRWLWRQKGIDLEKLPQEEQVDALWMAADHEITNCLRRARELGKKKGITFRAVYITSDMDGQKQEVVRVHHHLVISREGRELFCKAWEKLGSVQWRTMWEWQKDRTPLAEYMIDQVRRIIPAGKKYRSTQNVVHPKPKDRIVPSNAELKVPKGGELLFRRAFRKSDRTQYIRYLLPCRADEGSGGDTDEAPVQDQCKVSVLQV